MKIRFRLPSQLPLIVFVALIAALLAGTVHAQDTAPAAQPLTQADIQALHDLADSTRTAAEDAERYASDASRFLGIFEAISVAIALAAGAFGVVGVARLFAAQSALTDARQRILEELEDLRKHFEAEISERERDLKALEEMLVNTLDVQRKTAAQSTLALSLLPLGERQYRAQDYHGAADTYKRALTMDTINPLIYYRLGYVYVQSGQLEDAEAHLMKALEIDPEFALARAALGYVYRRMADKLPQGVEHDLMMNKGENYLLESLQAQPRLVDEDSESWWGSLGGLYRRRGQIDQAIYAYEQAAKVTPHSSYPFSNLALLYMQKHDRNEMLRTYKRVERLARGEAQAEVDNYWAYADLLTSSLALGKLEQADEALISVMDIAPTDSDYTLKLLIETLERLTEALGGKEAAPHVQEYIGRIRENIERRATAAKP